MIKSKISGVYSVRVGYQKPIQLTKVILDILSSHDANPYEIYGEYRRQLKDAEKVNKRKYNKGSCQNTWHYLRLLERLGLVRRIDAGETVMWRMNSTGLEAGWSHPRETLYPNE